MESKCSDKPVANRSGISARAAVLLGLAGIVGLAAHGVAAAQDGELPGLAFDAFGTFGLTHSSEDKADFPHSGLVPAGAGYSESWSANVDSLIAGQVTATLSSKLSGVVQVVSEYNYDKTFSPQVEWANIKYQLTPDVSVRVGRIALPIFMYSDTRKFGFGLTGVRSPVELYSMIPLTNNDGLDVLWRTALGTGINTLQMSVGQSKVKFSRDFGNAEAILKDQVTIANTYEFDAFTVRLNYGSAKLTIAAFEELFDAVRQFGAQGQQFAAKYDVRNSTDTFMGIGTSYDPGKWFVAGEWGHLRQDSILGNTSAWYLTGGARLSKLWRYGTLTPFATYARAKPSNAPLGLDVSGLPPGFAALGDQLNAEIAKVRSTTVDQATQTVGVRWDMARSVALTLQYDRIQLGTDSAGVLVNQQPGFERGGSLTLVSLAVSFVL